MRSILLMSAMLSMVAFTPASAGLNCPEEAGPFEQAGMGSGPGYEQCDFKIWREPPVEAILAFTKGEDAKRLAEGFAKDQVAAGLTLTAQTEETVTLGNGPALAQRLEFSASDGTGLRFWAVPADGGTISLIEKPVTAPNEDALAAARAVLFLAQSSGAAAP